MEYSIIFKALCDEKRINILKLLKTGEKCACTLIDETGIAQSALSYHMKILCNSKIVTGRSEGKWTYYSISLEGSICALEALKDITTLNLDINEDVCR